LSRSEKKNGREETPSVLIIDSQSVKADSWSEDTGYDAGKKIKGVKRHVLVDVLGLLIGVMVHSAAVSDRDGARDLLLRVRDQHRLPRMEKVYADGGYSGQLIVWVVENTDWDLEIVRRDIPHAFVVLPKRWVVERTFGWFMFWRVLNRHHERKHTTAENIMRIAMIRNMLCRLTGQGKSRKSMWKEKTEKTT